MSGLVFVFLTAMASAVAPAASEVDCCIILSSIGLRPANSFISLILRPLLVTLRTALKNSNRSHDKYKNQFVGCLHLQPFGFCCRHPPSSSPIFSKRQAWTWTLMKPKLRTIGVPWDSSPAVSWNSYPTPCTDSPPETDRYIYKRT